ncbi:hypothetical protein SCHPADRAFT_817807 [Schizopora paradoxa]|uniref:SLC41A/MgtE integral membrane domain-containing protein n=1 Tax=Schizopora paradoxa TaxID=27342 RepID=A0A0H2SD02_9AGAM|nr:hypothetical protein SCHPADRAFT_817807 [Schizopora paradoxa]
MNRLDLEDDAGRRSPAVDGFEASEDGSTSDDEGDVALLNSETRLRGRDPSEESTGATWSKVKDIVIETAPTLLFTTVGLLFTGELLDHVSHWKAMRRIDELIIIIPVILNLKGNLEMNLSARLGTASNVGELDDKTGRYGILFGNMALLQVQAALVSFVAACLSFVLGLIIPRSQSSSSASSELASNVSIYMRRPRPKVPLDPSRSPSGAPEFIMVATTGILSAALSSLILGSFMCTLVIFCRKVRLNPDNIAPPIAACLGDLITLCLLGLVSSLLVNFVETPVPLVLLILLVLTAVACAVIVHRNEYVRPLITQGWTPLFGAMVISTATGIILDLFVSRYSGFALLAVIISGLPGAVGSVFVSRISTALHAATPSSIIGPAFMPVKNSSSAPSASPRLALITLFVITIPVEIVFLAVLRGVGWLQLPFVFIAFSLVFFCITVYVSLILAKFLTNYLWSKGHDPDMYAMPIHSSVVDLVGQLLLVVCFEVVASLGGKVEVQPGHAH